MNTDVSEWFRPWTTGAQQALEEGERASGCAGAEVQLGKGDTVRRPAVRTAQQSEGT